MKKQGIFLIAGAVVLLVILCVSGVYLFKGISQYREEEDKLGAKIMALKKYYAKNPFPSEDNVDKEAENVKILDDWYGKLVEALTMNQIEPDAGERSPSKFKNSLSIKVGKLVKMSRPENNNGIKVKVPEDFAFGFERYSGIVSPYPRDVPRLTQQLSITEIISEKLIRSGIEEFLKIEREVFEDQASGTASDADEKRSRRRRSVRDRDKPESEPEVEKEAGLMGEDELYAKFHFEYVFKVKEKALVKVLNHLATMDMFVVITKLELIKEGSDVSVPVETIVEAEVAAAEAVPAGLEGLIPGLSATPAPAAPAPRPEAPSRRDRQVSGADMQVPMTVTLGIDVYRFKTKLDEKKGSEK